MALYLARAASVPAERLASCAGSCFCCWCGPGLPSPGRHWHLPVCPGDTGVVRLISRAQIFERFTGVLGLWSKRRLTARLDSPALVPPYEQLLATARFTLLIVLLFQRDCATAMAVCYQLSLAAAPIGLLSAPASGGPVELDHRIAEYTKATVGFQQLHFIFCAPGP